MNRPEFIPAEEAFPLKGEHKQDQVGTFSAHDLGQMEFPPIRYAVPGLIPEGCSILAGLPKLGKSWLVLDIALAVARGDYCLGNLRCEQGDVLYLALEDNKRRLKSRIEKMSPPNSTEPWPRSLRLATEWRRCEEGGLDDIREWAISASNPRLVIIDVLAQFRSGRAEGQNHYEYDYRAVKGLQELASELNLTIIVVHHVRKGHGDVDPFERVSGTLGLTGAADTTIILDRGGSGCTLYARGRDVEEYEKAVAFNRETCRWTLQGDASEVRRTDERGAILAALEDATEALTPRDIQVATGMARNNVDQLLFKMAKTGEVVKPSRGSYVHPSRSDLMAAAASPPGKNGKKVRNPEIGEADSG